MTIVFIFTGLCQLLAYMILFFASITGIAKKKWFKKLKKKWNFLQQDKYSITNTWLTMMLETYLDIMIACVLAFVSPRFIEMEGQVMNKWDKFNIGFAVLFMLILVLFTCFALYLFCYRFRAPVKLEKNKVQMERNKMLLDFYRL
jgi:ABC-type transport system involved in Fe-S cluster assembly fused permease/ATPase subunit